LKLQHSLGGIENLGPVNLDTRVFAEPWEQRIFGIHTTMMAESVHLSNARYAYSIKELPTAFKHHWTWGHLRAGAEDMNPFEYFKFRYYEKWLGGIAQFFVDEGYITAQELEEKTAFYRANPDAALPDRANPALRKQIDAYLRNGDSAYHEPQRGARFSVGDTVRIADPVHVDHSRLPGFLRNKIGTVEVVYSGAYSYFFSTGDGIGEPMPVYSVAFDAVEIWGPGKSEANTTIYADLFEAYVQPAK
jgi:nitrile hydratase subunit beta